MINREDLLSGTRPELGDKIIITVMESFQGYEVMEYKGMVWGISMRSKDAGQDCIMSCKQFTGGELTSYTELSDESRQRAIDRMLSMAKRVGANAIINFKFEQNFAYGGNAEVTAFGNAVVIKPIKNYVPTGGLGNILTEFVDLYANVNNIKQDKPVIKKVEENPVGKFVKRNESVFIACPYCSTNYGIEKTDDGEIKVRGYEDIDLTREGQQICCIKCNKIFTVPKLKSNK